MANASMAFCRASSSGTLPRNPATSPATSVRANRSPVSGWRNSLLRCITSAAVIRTPLAAATIHHLTSGMTGLATYRGRALGVRADGSFELDGFSPGRGGFACAAEGYETLFYHTREDESEVIDVGLLVMNPLCTLDVRVREAGVTDFTGYHAWNRHSDDKTPLPIAPDGTRSLPARTGPFEVNVTRPDGSLTWVSGMLPPGERRSVEVDLSAGIEPDQFVSGTTLNAVQPGVTLSVLDSSNAPLSFPVTATFDSFKFAPTGYMVFGHANIQFFGDTRRLKIAFAEPVDRLPLLPAVRLGDTRRFPDARHCHLMGELDFAFIHAAGDRRGRQRFRCACQRQVAFAGEQAGSGIETDPTGARHVGLGPGMQIGDVLREYDTHHALIGKQVSVDVGHGDATLLQGPDFTILIDAGRHMKIAIHDHVIVARSGWTSFRALGLLQTARAPK